MKIINQLFVCVLFLTSFVAEAQNCDSPQSAELVRIYFVNGMDNKFIGPGIDDQDMVSSKDELAKIVGINIGTFGNSFNFQEDGYAQAKQVYQQREAQPVEFWQWMARLNKGEDARFPVPLAIKDADITARIKVAKDLNAKQYFIDKDLQVMVAQYLLDLKSGKKVVLVSHSQGNFYANNAYIYIKNNYPQYSNSFGIVMTASPASINASLGGLGPHTNNAKDKVLNGVMTVYPVLPYNENYTEPTEWASHSFNKVYLKQWGLTRIKPDILNVIAKLKTPVKHIDCATDAEIPVQIATWTATNVTATTATLNGYLTSGRNVFTWFNWQFGSSDVPACSSNQSVYPGGISSVGQKTLNLYNIPSNTDVYYRACAIGVGNRISEGMVVDFKTQPAPPPPPVSKRNITVCGIPTVQPRNSYTIILNMNGLSIPSASYSFHSTDDRTSPKCSVVLIPSNTTTRFGFHLYSVNISDLEQHNKLGTNFKFYGENQQLMYNCSAAYSLSSRSTFCDLVF
jgi:hypothetical protein